MAFRACPRPSQYGPCTSYHFQLAVHGHPLKHTIHDTKGVSASAANIQKQSKTHSGPRATLAPISGVLTYSTRTSDSLMHAARIALTALPAGGEEAGAACEELAIAVICKTRELEANHACMKLPHRIFSTQFRAKKLNRQQSVHEV